MMFYAQTLVAISTSCEELLVYNFAHVFDDERVPVKERLNMQRTIMPTWECLPSRTNPTPSCPQASALLWHIDAVESVDLRIVHRLHIWRYCNEHICT